MKYALISATRATRVAFEDESPLGQSLRILQPLLKDVCRLDIIHENKDGLSACYNAALRRAIDAGCERAILIHDDAQLQDGLVLDKLEAAFATYDIVGVAGARSLSVNTGKIAWWNCAAAHKAGWITHPMYDRRNQGYYLEYYGPAPMPCVVLDGVFLAVRLDRLREKPFDEQFTFDFYDLDFTLSHHLDGLTVGVWPIAITHMSRGGGHTSERFRQAQELFRLKHGGVHRPLNIKKKMWMLRKLAGGGSSARLPNPPGEFTASRRRGE